MRTLGLLTTLFIFLFGCESKPEKTATDETGTTIPVEKVSSTRTTVKEEAVASYSEKTDNPLNDWYFSVKIYETPQTFHYLMKLQFEEIRGTDTLKIPDLGFPPEPVIKKGKDKYSCIIGFLDQDKQFREYKKVYVKGNSLKVTSLKHYSVTGG